MKNILLLVGCAQAIKMGHPDVPKSEVPPDFTPDQKGWAGQLTGEWEGNAPNYHEYERVIPEHFQDLNDDDRFTRSMIEDFASESRNEAGMPSGKFYLNEDAAKRAGEQVLSTHLNLKGDKLKEYMNVNFWEAWKAADAAGDGKVEAARMGEFMKSLAHDYTLDLQ